MKWQSHRIRKLYLHHYNYIREAKFWHSQPHLTKRHISDFPTKSHNTSTVKWGYWLYDFLMISTLFAWVFINTYSSAWLHIECFLYLKDCFIVLILFLSYFYLISLLLYPVSFIANICVGMTIVMCKMSFPVFVLNFLLVSNFWLSPWYCRNALVPISKTWYELAVL